jgi:hypothetical protein
MLTICIIYINYNNPFRIFSIISKWDVSPQNDKNQMYNMLKEKQIKKI